MKGIYFMDPDDKEFEKTNQKRWEKSELPMEAAVACKLKTFWHREIVANPTKPKKTKHACIVEAGASTTKLVECTLPKDHEDHIAEKGFNSISHCNLMHKFVPMPQAMKIPDVKAATDKE